MARRSRGTLAQCFDGRIDRSILSDIGVLLGLVLVGAGLWQLSRPAGWIFAGLALIAISLIAILPAKSSLSKPPKANP